MESIGGIEIAKVFELGKLDLLTDYVSYASGSLVEGFGNSLSDIDVFIICNNIIKTPISTKKKDCTINIVFYQRRRLDYEFYKINYISMLSKKLNKIKVGKEFVAEKLSLHEELFIHRLKIGIPIHAPNEFETLKKHFDFKLFQGYLVQQSLHMIDGAIEDITGCVEDKDINNSLFRCINLVGLTADLFCYTNGETNTLAKWRNKKLMRLAHVENFQYVYDNFWTLSFPNINEYTKENKHLYIENALNFANNVVEFSYNNRS